MSSNLTIQKIEKEQMKKQVPAVHVGDTVRVSIIIVEGKKKRTQNFEGTIVKVQNTRSRVRFTVRRVIDRVGVEKTFLLHSPLVSDVKVIRKGKVRRAKLNYLRDRIGAKAARIKALN